MEKLIYALKCPITNRVHYIGKSTQGMRRPMQHISNSHSEKIKEWVDDLKMLNNKPDIVILQELLEGEDIDLAEKQWISRYMDKGAVLLNEHLITPILIRPDLDERLKEDGSDKYKAIGRFVAEKRKSAMLTQEEFAEKLGIALTVLRKIEQGKDNFIISSLLDVLSMFGCTLGVKKI